MALLVFGGFGGFGRGADFLDFGVPAAAGQILVARLDDHKALLAQGLEVFAHRRLHALAVELVHDFRFDFRERLLAFVVMFQNLKNQIALLGFHYVRQIILLHLENGVFQFFGKFAALVDSEEAALRFGAAVGKALGHFAEVFAVLDALQRESPLFSSGREALPDSFPAC